MASSAYQNRESRQEETRKYYKQEDIVKEASFTSKGTKEKLKEMLKGSESPVKSPPKLDLQQASSPIKLPKAEKTPESERVSSNAGESQRIVLSRGNSGVAKHANSVIDRHHDRLKQYGCGVPKEQMYPYKPSDTPKHSK